MPQKILKKKKLSSFLINSNINNSKSNYGDALFVNRKNQNASSILIGKLKDKDSDGYSDISDCSPNDKKQHGVFKKVINKAIAIVTGKTPTPTDTGKFQGPVQQGTSESTFRTTGVTTPSSSSQTSPSTFQSSKPNSGGGGGYSYVDPNTGKGYEVNPTGIKTEVIPTTKTSARSLIPQALQPKTGQATYNPTTGTSASPTGQKKSIGNINAVPKNTAFVTSTGKVDKSFDKFGRPIEYYSYTQQDVAKRSSQKEYDSSVEKVINNQTKYYQKLVNENKISPEEATTQLNKVINVYSKDLSQGMNNKLQNKLTSIQKEYETERVKKGVPLVEEQQYGTQSFKDSRTGSSFGLSYVSASTDRSNRMDIGVDGSSSNRDTSGSFISNIINRNKKIYKKQIESYSPTLGAFISASPTGQGSTGNIRQPTKEERYYIEKYQYEGDLYGGAIKSVPASMLSLGLSQMGSGVTKEDLTILYPESKVGTVFNLVNPAKHYEVYKSKFEYEQAVKKANIISNKLNEIDKQYTEGKIDYGEYEAKFNYYSKDKDFQRVLNEQEQRKGIHGFISESEMKRKNLAHFAVGGIDFLTYINPATRVARGGESLLTGVEELGQAQTKQERISAKVQIGVGGLLVGSGFSGGTSLFGKFKGQGGKTIQTLSKVENRFGIKKGVGERLIKFGESRTGKITGKVVSEVPSVGISGLYGYGVYKETEDIGAGISSGLGAYAGMKIPSGVSKFVKGKPLTQSEVIKLENELKQLEQTEALDTQFIYKGKGTKVNSDKVQIISTQETPNFKRVSTVEGDLIINEKGTFLFPEGKGITKTIGKFGKKSYSNIQSFEVGAKGKGILLKQFGDIQISTQVGSSTYIPKESVTQIMNNPRNWFQYAKESLRIKLGEPKIQKGGQIVKSIETDKTPRTMSLNRDIELNENILLKSFGVSTSRGRKGTFFEYAEKPKSEINIIKTKLEPSRKTPFSKTFGSEEQVSQPVDLISPRINQVQVRTEQVKVETPKDFSLISKSISRETSKVSKGELEELTKVKVTPRLSSLLFGGEVSKEKQREELKVSEREINKERFNFSNLISPRIKEETKEKQIFITPQINLQRLNQQEIQKQVTKQTQPNPIIPLIFHGEIKPPIPKPEINPPFNFNREKTSTSKEQPYNVMIRRDATKFNKARWEQINTQPLTRESAMSMGARDVDETISARYKITKAKEVVQQVRDKVGNWVDRKIQPKAVDTGDDYYKSNQNKFRTFRQVRGKKINMPMTYIERAKYRSDHPQEVQTLRTARESSVRGFFGM